MAVISMRQLLETGVHFGHRARRWNPKMRQYIFTERNGIHIIDLQQTIVAIEDAYRLTRDIVAEGGIVLFVGTKRQAQETIESEARRCGMPFVNQRWLGGTLTNWRTIRERIQHLKSLEARRDRGEFELVTKKEALMLTREIEKLNERLGGIREMTRLPDMLFIVDTPREDTAVHEANILDIRIVAMVDTNCDPELIDYVIPSNDDAIRAIKLITSKLADAVLEGAAMRKEELELVSAEAMQVGAYDQFGDEDEDEAYLGEATLAKLRAGALAFEGDRDDLGDEEELGDEPELDEEYLDEEE
jgi:small subunit ribosomal protein S2